MKLIFITFSFFLFFASNNFSKAANFKNFKELSKCVDYYNSYIDYKKKLKDCFVDQNINLDDKTLNVIRNKSRDFEYGAIDNIFELKKSNSKKIILTDKNLTKINQYIKLNPQDIYVLTEDINIITYKNNILGEFERQELLLNVYNSFEPLVLSEFAQISPPEEKPKLSNQGFGMLAGIGAAALGGAGFGGGGGSSGGSSAPATLSYTVSSTTVSECGNAITIKGNLTKAHSSNVTITYTLSGTATNSVDYNLSSTTSTIVAGATSGSITLTPINDTTNETSETVIVSASTTDISTTGNTSTTITIYDYVLACNSTAYTEDTSQQNTITNRTAWTNVDGDSTGGHPFELLNIHKAHSFKDGSGQYLTGEGETVHVADFGCDENHEQFNNKTVTMIDNDATFNPSHTDLNHCVHVAGIAVGDINASRQGVAPDADVAFSHIGTSGTNMAGDLDSARALSAVSSNNSWGFCSQKIGSTCVDTFEATTLQNLMTANGTTHAEQLANSTSLFTSSTDVDAYVTALDNFQNNGIIVFSAGNVVEDDADAMAALPFFYDGVKETIDLSDAWITVIYADYTGSSLNSASTSDFTRKGNACGNSKEYCLTVDDFKISSGSHVTSGGSSEYANIQGSSMGSPMISGGIALLAQAFPNHTPEQLTDRLLASANNGWFTPTGNTTFTKHGASIKHGYHNEWGHGVPDFYAALSPITTSLNPLSFGGGGGSGGGGSGSANPIPFANMIRYSVESSSITSSNSIGDAIFNGLENKSIYAYDALNGGFKLNISDFIYHDKISDQKIELSFKDELSILKNFDYEKISLNKKYQLSEISNEYIKFGNELGNTFSITLDDNNIALQNFNLYNHNSYQNPFTTENYGIGFNGNLNFFGGNLFVGYNNSEINPLTNINKETVLPIESLALSINLNNEYFDKLSFTTGLNKEKETFLLSKANGGFKLDDDGTLSNFFGFNLLKNLNESKSIYLSSMMGDTKINNLDNTIFTKSTNILSSSFEFGFEQINLLGDDKINISLSQPNRAEDGQMSFRLFGLADKNGILPYTDHTINVSPSGRQKDLKISYYKNITDNFKIGVKALFTDDLGHIRSEFIDRDILVSGVISF